MELDLDQIKGGAPLSRGKTSVPRAGETGEGLPYAPEGFPMPGDKWKWRVGRRRTASGFWFDRYLYPPDHLRKPGKGFPSRTTVKAFLKKEFPNANVEDFFNSFIWKVPCEDPARKEVCYSSGMGPLQLEISDHSGSESASGTLGCKARNKMCSLGAKARSYSLAMMDCDICCSETGFCRDCCCVLCCKTVDWSCGGYSFVRCEAIIDENYICGHLAHVSCSLRSYMAGTVDGSIGLKVEYLCRRCDKKTDLMPHVTKLLQTCESLDSPDDIEKILNVGFCILCHSDKTRAKNLLHHIEGVLAKLKSGIPLEDIWMVEDDTQSASDAGRKSYLKNAVPLLGGLDSASNHEILDIPESDPPKEVCNVNGTDQEPVYITSDHCIESLKLENEIDRALQSLKKSQESEYKMAEEKLYAHKDFLVGLCQQLNEERSELAKHSSSPTDNDSGTLLASVLSRVDQIKQVMKHRQMLEIGKGFGRTPKGILKEHFGLLVED